MYLFTLEPQPVFLHCDVDAADGQRAVDAQVPPILVHQMEQEKPIDLRDD